MEHINDSEDKNINFILHLASVMMRFGASVYDVDDSIWRIVKYLSLKGQIIIFGNILFTAFGEVLQQRVSLLSLTAGSSNVQKLEAILTLVNQLTSGQIDVQEGTSRLKTIEISPPLYNKFFQMLAWILSSAGIAFVFLGTWREAVVAGMIGLIISLVDRRFSNAKYSDVNKLFEPMAAFLASIIAVVASIFINPLCVTLSIICGLIMLMPGFSLTVAMSELAVGHTISGAIRLIRCVVTVLLMGTGVFLGATLSHLINISTIDYTPASSGLIWIISATIVTAIAFCIYLNISVRHIFWVILACVITTLFMLEGCNYWGPVLGTGIASLVAGLTGNLYSRWKNCNPIIIKIPCAFMLVPGSMAFKVVVYFIKNDVMTGWETLFSTIGVAISIIVGYLLAELIFYPRRIWSDKKG